MGSKNINKRKTLRGAMRQNGKRKEHTQRKRETEMQDKVDSLSLVVNMV